MRMHGDAWGCMGKHGRQGDAWEARESMIDAWGCMGEAWESMIDAWGCMGGKGKHDRRMGMHGRRWDQKI